MRAMSDHESDGYGGTFTMGLLFGTAVGVALGLLLAPKPGADFRRDVKSSMDALKRRASRAYDQAANTAEDLAHRGADALHRTVDMASRATDRGRSMAKEMEDTGL